MEKNSRTPNTEQENRRTTTTNNDKHLDNDNRPTIHLDINFRPDFEQGSNRTEHLAEQFRIHWTV